MTQMGIKFGIQVIIFKKNKPKKYYILKPILTLEPIGMWTKILIYRLLKIKIFQHENDIVKLLFF